MVGNAIAKEIHDIHSWANQANWAQFLRIFKESTILKQEIDQERKALA